MAIHFSQLPPRPIKVAHSLWHNFGLLNGTVWMSCLELHSTILWDWDLFFTLSQILGFIMHQHHLMESSKNLFWATSCRIRNIFTSSIASRQCAKCNENSPRKPSYMTGDIYAIPSLSNWCDRSNKRFCLNFSLQDWGPLSHIHPLWAMTLIPEKTLARTVICIELRVFYLDSLLV